MRRIGIVLLACILLSSCSAISKGEEDESSSVGVENVAVQQPLAVEQDISDSLYSLDDDDVKISPLAWVYESRTGIQLISPLEFVDTLNTSTSFQLEHHSPEKEIMVRVEQTEFKPVDFERLVVDEALFARNVVPTNIKRQDSKFKAESDHAYMTYTTMQGDIKQYCSVFLVNTGYEIFKIITVRSDDFELEIPLTAGRVKPQSNADYRLIVDEIVRVQVRDMAFSIPKGKENQWAIREGDSLLTILDGSSDINVYLLEGKAESDIPTPDSFQSALGPGEWQTQIPEEGYDYYYTTSADRSFRVICHLQKNGDLYIFSSHNIPLCRYLNTIRMAEDPDIFTLVKLGESFERNVSGSTVLGYRRPIGELSIDVTASDWPIKKEFDSWEVKIKEDNWVRVMASAVTMTSGTVKASDPTISTVKLNGDHFIATTTDGGSLYFKEIIIDNKRWDVVARGLEGFTMAKSVKQLESYKFLQGYTVDHFTFDKATFAGPMGTIADTNKSSAIYTLPDDKGRLTFELITKDNKTLENPKYKWINGVCYTGETSAYIELKIGKDYRVTAYGDIAKEMLYTLRVGK